MRRPAAGELMMVGFEGYSLGSSLREYILEWMVGGVILFARNIRDISQAGELCADLQRLRKQVSDLPLLIAVDQEGGAVARFREGVTLFPGNMALGVGGTEEDADLQGRVTGRQLRAIGVNMNLAPVLDLYSLPGNPALGLRSLGSDPRRVATLGSALIRGQQEEGIAATAKHFPGKGRAQVDSHESLPRIIGSAKELNSRDQLPFRAAIASGVKAIMTSHASYPALDKEDSLPATLSRRIVSELLRKSLGYKNLIVTDDLGMGAIGRRYSPDEAALLALKAGVDILLFCHSHSDRGKARLALEAGLSSDKALARKGEESLERIRRLKTELRSPPLPPAGGPVEGGESPALRIARGAVTVIRDRRRMLPLERGEKATIVWMRPERTVEAESRFEPVRELGGYLEVEGISAKTIAVPLSPSREEIDDCLRRTREAECLIVTGYDAYRYGGQVGLIKELGNRHPKSVLAVLRDPRDVSLFPEAGTVVASFGFTPSSLKALAEVISGKISSRRKVAGIAGITAGNGR